MRLLLFCVLVAQSALPGAVDARFLAPQAKVLASFRVPQVLNSVAGPDVRQWIVESFYGCPLAEKALGNMTRAQFFAEQPGERTFTGEWLIILEGIWDWPAVRDCVGLAGYVETSFRGFPFMSPPGSSPGKASIALYETGSLLIGPGDAIRGGINRALDGNAGAQSELLTKAEELDSVWDHWILGLGSPLEFNSKTSKELLAQLPKSRKYWLAFSGSELFTMELRLEMMTPEEAAIVLQLFDFLPRLVKLRSAEARLQSDLLSYLKAETVDNCVKVKAVLPGAILWTQLGQITAGSASKSRFSRQRMNTPKITNTSTGHPE